MNRPFASFMAGFIEFRGVSATVTGGARGIGKGIARRLLEGGAGVWIADIDDTAGLDTVRELSPLGEIGYTRADVRVEAEVERAAADCLGRFGGIGALVNNAGVSDPDGGPLEHLPLETWNRILQTNLTGYFLFAKHCIPHLRERRGAMVNIASTRALQSEPDTEARAASKGASWRTRAPWP